MGAFVLGILFGWLAEWVFFTFWQKGGKNSDCSSIKAELEERKKEINRLQNRLNEATASAASSSANAATSTKSASATKSAPATNSTATKATSKATSKASPKKATAKKAAPKKAKAKKTGDDFTKLSGIGPSMETTLKGLGIDTYAKLAGTDDDILRDMLENSGARLNNNKEAMDSWNEQATLAAKGDFDGLKKLQEALKK